LLTLAAARAIASADAIVYDHLVNPEVLVHARQRAELIYAGKRTGEHTLVQSDINQLLVTRAMRGQVVVRLKGGDPFIFGRGGEEAEALADAGIDWTVIPGVSSGVAAAAYAGIPLTHRGHSSSVTFLTGHPASEFGGETLARPIPKSNAASSTGGTLVFYMCASTLTAVARKLIDTGHSPSTPVAVIRWATYDHQEVYRGTLDDVAALTAQEALFIEPPAIAVVGSVVSLQTKLNWFGKPAVSLDEVRTRGEQFQEQEEDGYVPARRRD
jgi:uroporphyrin-III C-methyltransferase